MCALRPNTLYCTAAFLFDAAIFEKRTKYGVCVSCSRHPELNGYIRTVLHSCRALLQRGLMERLLVCVCDARGMPTEYTSIEVEVRKLPSHATFGFGLLSH